MSLVLDSHLHIVCQPGPKAAPIDTQFLRLLQPVALWGRIDGWRVWWLGGRDRGRVSFVVGVELAPVLARRIVLLAARNRAMNRHAPNQRREDYSP
jgi:hypothetical protein